MKKTSLISAFPACGKTYLVDNQETLTFGNNKKYSFVDSESSQYEKYSGWEKKYVDDIMKKVGTVDFIFISQHEEVLKELKNRNIPFIAVCPCGDEKYLPASQIKLIKQQWFGRMLLRDNGHIKNIDNWLNLLINNYDTWTTYEHITKYNPMSFYFLDQNQYLSDIITELYQKKENESDTYCWISKSEKEEEAGIKEYELVNISDPYTFLADNDETAALLIFVMGKMGYGATDQEGELIVPISVTVFPDSREWYKEKFGRSVLEGFKAKKKAVCKALESVMLGTFDDREKYETELSKINDPDQKENFIKAWQNNCSSVNDIGTYCHKLAERLSED